MPYLNSYDYGQFAPERRVKAIHQQALLTLPEIGALQSVPIGGTTYKTVVVTEEGDAASFRSFGQGALSARSTFDEVENETFGIDRKVESILRAENETDQEALFGGERRFNTELKITTGNVFRRLVQQLYQGTAYEPEGFGGFPEAVKYKIDALKQEWNGVKDYVAGGADYADSQKPDLYSVYLVYSAPAPTEDSPGMKWIWGNRKSIYLSGQRRIVDIDEGDGSYEAYRQHLNGQVGVGFTTDVDVIEIANVPSFALTNFFLDTVIARAMTLFPSGRKANRIFIHRLCQHQMWLALQNTSRASATIQIVQPNETGRFGQAQTDFFDGTTTIPFVTSEVMPATGFQTVTSTTTQKAAYDAIRVNAGVTDLTMNGGAGI